MGRKLATVALLAVLGLVVGHVLTHPVARSYVYVDVYSVPGHSADAPQLAAEVRSLHVHGVRVRVHDAHAFQVAGHGSSAQAAVKAAMTVRKAIAGMPHPRYNVISGGVVDALRRGQGYPFLPSVIGLASGAAIGILIGIGPGFWSSQMRPRIRRLRRSAGATTAGTA